MFADQCSGPVGFISTISQMHCSGLQACQEVSGKLVVVGFARREREPDRQPIAVDHCTVSIAARHFESLSTNKILVVTLSMKLSSGSVVTDDLTARLGGTGAQIKRDDCRCNGDGPERRELPKLDAAAVRWDEVLSEPGSYKRQSMGRSRSG